MMHNFVRDPITGGLINTIVPPSSDLEVRVQQLEKEIQELKQILIEMRREYVDRETHAIQYLQGGNG